MRDGLSPAPEETFTILPAHAAFIPGDTAATVFSTPSTLIAYSLRNRSGSTSSTGCHPGSPFDLMQL
eukprot:COSAG01_NODE_2612_length_7381_cov_11.186762_4_plen_67_part_00